MMFKLLIDCLEMKNVREKKIKFKSDFGGLNEIINSLNFSLIWFFKKSMMFLVSLNFELMLLKQLRSLCSMKVTSFHPVVKS